MNIDLSDHRVPDRDLFGWDLWVPFIAAVSLLLVISAGLLTLTAELRSGWVSDHEVQMDKTAAIHVLMFRR